EVEACPILEGVCSVWNVGRASTVIMLPSMRRSPASRRHRRGGRELAPSSEQRAGTCRLTCISPVLYRENRACPGIMTDAGNRGLPPRLFEVGQYRPIVAVIAAGHRAVEYPGHPASRAIADRSNRRARP